jgi:hypothetical protein
VGPGDTYALYFDSVSGWEIPPGKHLADLAGGELEFARRFLSGFALNIRLADRNPEYEVTSPAGNVVRVSTRKIGNDPLDITLDPVSWLPVKQASISLADPAHPTTSENQVKEWMTVGDPSGGYHDRGDQAERRPAAGRPRRETSRSQPDVAMMQKMGIGLLRAWFISDAVDLHFQPRHRKLARHRGARRFVCAKELGVNLVHGAKILAVRQKHGALHHVRHGRAAAFQNPADVGQHQARLVLDIPSSTLSVAGLTGTCPDTKMKSPARTAGE